MSKIIAHINCLLLSSIIFITILQAQEQRSTISRANEYYNLEAYAQAIPLYTKLVQAKKPSIQVMEKLAACYRELNRYDKALDWYEKIVQLPGIQSENWLYYGDMLKCLGRYQEAKTAYQQYSTQSKTVISDKITGCDSALIWMKSPAENYKVQNQWQLNTHMSDWGATWYAGNRIVFTSDSLRYAALDKQELPGEDNYNRTGRSFQRLYMTASIKDNGSLGVVTSFDPVINHSAYHVGPVAFNENYDTAYITVTNPGKIPYERNSSKGLYGSHTGTRRLELYISARTNDKGWQLPVPFPYNHPATYSIGHAALSRDGNILYFVSDRPGGLGKTDLWYSERMGDNSWGEPHHCGSVINTVAEEAFPTIGPDGALYFSSKGHIGMGGYDIFVSYGSRDQWSEPVNLKYPRNSPGDDFYYVVSDSTTGFLASNRDGGKGDDDIYSYITTPAPQLPPASTQVIVQPVKEPKQELTLQNKTPLKEGDRFILKNLYYDYNKWNIRPDAQKVLDSLAFFLKQHPSVKRIMLSSHTDSRGSDEYNMVLSEKRARAAVAYLVQQGITSDRLIAKGYGEMALLNHCANGIPCSEAEHQTNRRTEVLLIKITP